MFLLSSASGIARSFATLTLGGRDGGETRGPAGQAGLRHASAPASPGGFTSLMRRAPRAAAPRWVAARASPGGSGGGGGSSYGGDLSMDSSRDDSGARNDYWRGGAGGSEGRRGRGGGGRGSYARAEGDRGASPSRGARGRGRGDGKASHGDSRRGFQSPRGGDWKPSHASADRRHGGRGGRGGGGGGRGRNVEPCSALAAERKNKMRQHTGTLSSCESCDAVLEYASEHARTFTAVNFSTAIHKLGKLNRSARGRRTKHAARLIDDPRFADLETALAASLALFASPDASTHPSVAEFHGVWGAREVSCALWGFANCGRTAEMWNAGIASNNGRTTVCAHCPELFADLLRKVAAFDGDAFSSQNLSNAVWALAKMHSGPQSQSQSQSESDEASDEAGSQNSQDALVGHATDALEDAIRDRLSHPPKNDAFIPQGVSNSMWALAVLKKHEHQRSYGGDANANVADGKTADAKSPQRRRDEWNDRVRTSVEETDETNDDQDDQSGISTATARAFSEYIAAPGAAFEFKSMELSNVIWAISTMRCRVSDEVGEALNEAVVRACDDAPHVFSTQSVANILWAAGNTPELVPLSTRALDRLARMTYAKFPEFTKQGLANTLWGFASAGYNPGEGLFREIRRAWVEQGDEYTVIELNNMLWAMHTLKQSPGRKVFAAVHARVAALCAEDARRELPELTFNHVANFMYHMAQYEELPDPRTMVRLEEALLRKIASRGGEKLLQKHQSEASESDAMYPTAAALRARGDTAQSSGGDLRREPGEGAFVTARAVRRAADSIQPHLVSNTLWAFSVLRYKPGAALMRAFDDLVEARVEDYTDQSLSMTVFAYANLAFEPKPETLAKLVAQCEERVVAGGFTPQGLSNSFWGWAVLGASSPRLVAAYAARFAETERHTDASARPVASVGSETRLSRVDLVQIYQASLAFAHCVEKNGRLECDVGSVSDKTEGTQKPNLLRGALLERAKAVWEQTSTGRVTISSLHREVSETLTFMAIPHEIEMVADDNFSLDIALRGRAVAIEVDGPSHFFANKPSEYMGADKLREKVLAAKGWTVLRLPWHEWRQDFGMDERCDYLANLLYRGAGLTVKDASVVPGGVRMAGRTFSENDGRVGTNASSGWTDPGLPGTFDSEADGMSGYVRRVTADPGSDVRVNRAGSVIVEDNTFDSDAKALRDNEYVPRVYSKDKPDARAGYEDGGYDPARSKADEILRRVERSAKRQATKDETLNRSLGLTDVAPYGMTLEPGAGAAARRGEGAPRARRRAAADEDAERRKKLFLGTKSVQRGGDVASDAMSRSVPNRAASVRRRAPRANASEPNPRAAGAAGAAGPAIRDPRSAIRRRRVRVSVPKAASSRFAGAPRGAAAPSVSRRVLSGKGAGKASATGETATGETATDRVRKETPPPPGFLKNDEDENANAKERSALWSSAKKNEQSREAPVSALRGVGAKSAARLAALGVDSVGDLAALSDGAAAEKGASVRGLRDKARRALGGAWET